MLGMKQVRILRRLFECVSGVVAMVLTTAVFANAAVATVVPEPNRAQAAQAWLGENGVVDASDDRIGDQRWGVARTSRVDAAAYLFVFDWPKNSVLFVSGLGGTVQGVTLGEAVLPWRIVDDGLLVGGPDHAPDGAFVVISVAFEGDAIRFEPPRFVGVGAEFLGEASLRLETRSGLEVRYTTDGSDPGPNSNKYEKPIVLGETTEVRARSYFAGRPVSAIVSQRFERFEAWPAREAGAAAGLIEQEYAGDWNTMPDFDAMTPRATRVLKRFGLDASFRAEFIGLRQRGVLRIDDGGVYRFALTSDDGGRLWIDGHLVVDNDGLHGAVTRRGVAPLAPGGHEIVVEYFNKTGGFALRVEMAEGLETFKPIADDLLSHDEQGEK
jgi:alpha-L-fucosidase